jgi:uncharacterized protein YukE
MTDHILYNFEANNGSLDDINAHMADIHSAKSDIAHVFNLLGQVYEGEGADALQHHHGVIQARLEDHMTERQQTHSNASNQQELMQQIDRSNASQF